MPKFNFKNQDSNPNFWSILIGKPSEFSLESRIFHSISLALICLLIVYIPYNLYAGLIVASASALFVGLLVSYQFYYSRFYHQPHSNLLFGLIGVVILGLNYFTNSGINGSTDVIWPSYLLLIFAITPYPQHLKWLFIYLLWFIVLHAIEYKYPQWVQHPFVPGKGQFTDRITAFPIPLLSIYIIMTFIRRNYDTEKKITEEKTLAIESSKEQLLIKKDQLEKTNTEKNKLMSIISHDLRSPLINIQNYLNLLADNRIDSDERAHIEHALLKSTNNAMEMLSNLLHWSKSQMKGASVQLAKVNLINTLQNTLEIENQNALKKEITLNYHIPEKYMVIADVDMLQLVVRNLISNAIKFTSPGGTINVYAQLIHNECKLTVKDNGKGIALDKREDIFSIKSKSTFGTHNEKGVGLGLVLCKEFIERQGGRISFESNEGNGSSFFIYLPVNHP